MNILSIFVLAPHGATIVSAHQSSWFSFYSYQSQHEAFLATTTAEKFIERANANEITRLRNHHQHYYIKKTPNDQHTMIFVTDTASPSDGTSHVIFSLIRKVIGNISIYSGTSELDACRSSLYDILVNPGLTAEQKRIVREPTPVELEKPKPVAAINPLFLFNKKSKEDLELPWDYTGRDGLYCYDYSKPK